MGLQDQDKQLHVWGAGATQTGTDEKFYAGPTIFGGMSWDKTKLNTGTYNVQFSDFVELPTQAYEMYDGLQMPGSQKTIHRHDLNNEFESKIMSRGLNGEIDFDAHRTSFNSLTELEGERKRIIDAFAILDVNHLINDNNRAMMLNWMKDTGYNGYLARANYEIAVSNVYDMRETYIKTQQKIQDMTRLGEVQTYYKLYYKAKKKIILETIVVLLALIVLYALRSNGILADGLFNLFFVIILFTYIFFRLSWQIVDFMSRDRRYFDKYDWGELDGSYNFYEFKELPTEVVVRNKRRVTDCLEKFFQDLESNDQKYETFKNLICSYTYLADEDTEKYKEGIPLYLKALWIVIYETLHWKYYGSTEKINVGPTKFDKKDDCNNLDDKVITQDVDEDDKNKVRIKAVAKCEEWTEDLKKHLHTLSENILINIETASPPQLKSDYSHLIDYDVVDGKIDRIKAKLDPNGIIRINWWLYNFYDKVKYLAGLPIKKRNVQRNFDVSPVETMLQSGSSLTVYSNEAISGRIIVKRQTSSSSSSEGTQ